MSHTAQGLNARWTHPWSVNKEALCCGVCVCVFILLVHRVVVYCILHCQANVVLNAPYCR